MRVTHRGDHSLQVIPVDGRGVRRRGDRRRLRSCGVLAARGSASPGQPTLTCPGRSSDSLSPGRSSESRSPGRGVGKQPSPPGPGRETVAIESGVPERRQKFERKKDRCRTAPPSFRDGAVRASILPAMNRGTTFGCASGAPRPVASSSPSRRGAPESVGDSGSPISPLPKLVLRPAGVRGAGCAGGAGGSSIRE